MKFYKIYLTLSVFLVFYSVSQADIPNLINFQGILDSAGNPLANRTVSVEFKIYDASSGGNVWWSETTSVTTNASGVFNAVLGSNNPIPDTTFNDTARWLGVKVGTNPEIAPRQKLVSVPYSYRVGTVDGASGGKISGDVEIQSQLTVSGRVGIGTLFPQNQLQVDGDPSVTNGDHEILSARNNFASGPAYAGISLGYRANGTQSTGGIIRSLNALPLMLGTTNGPTTLVVTDFPYNVGIGTTTPGAGLVVSGSDIWNSAIGIQNTTANMEWRLATTSDQSFNIIKITGATFTPLTISATTGNVGIGTTGPQGALDVSSTTGALIVPRMTTAQRDALTAVNGMIIYNTTTNQFNFYENGAWVTK